MAGEKAVLSCHHDQTIGALDAVCVHLDAAIFQEVGQALPALQSITDRLGNGTLLRYGGELGFQPGLQTFDQGLGFRLSHGAAPRCALPADAALDGIERRDALERLAGDRRRAPSVDIEEQPTPMRPAKDERDLAVGELRPYQLLIDLVAVALDPAGIARQQSQSMLTPAPGRVGVDDAWWIRSGPWPFIPGDGPAVSRLGPTAPGIAHRHLGLVHHNHGRGAQQLFYSLIARGRFPRAGPTPNGTRRAVDRKALQPHVCALPIKRLMPGMFVDDDG